MKSWLIRIWIALLLVLFALSIPACLRTEEGGWFNAFGKQSTFDPQGPLARQQLDAFWVTLWVTGFVLIVVGGIYLVAMWKFRIRKGDDPEAIPPQSHGHPILEVGLVAASAGLLVIIAIPAFSGVIMMKRMPPEYVALDPIEVNVIGYQWWFNFEYPDEGFYSANELVIPAGRPVELNLITQDVIHSFWIPKLSGKTDLVSGQTNTMWIMADEAGYFWGQCAEFCGDSHAYMLFRTVALPPEEYAAWIEQQKAATVNEEGLPLVLPENVDPQLVAQGAELFRDNCARCHSLESGRQGVGAPNLAHFASRSSIAAGWYENEWSEGGANDLLFHWIKYPDQVKPGNNMWRGFMQENGRDVLMEGLNHTELTDAEVHALVGYLSTLKHPDAEQFSPSSL